MNVTTTITVLACLTSLVQAESAMQAAERLRIEKVEIQPGGATRLSLDAFFPITG